MPKLAAPHVASRLQPIPAFSICVALLIAPGSADAQVVKFLSPAPGADGTIAYAVGAEVDLRLPFTATKGPLEFRLLPFVGEQGDVLSVEPSIVEQPKLGIKEQRLSFSMDQPILTLRLKGPGLPTAGKYAGAVSVVQKGALQQTTRIVLTRALMQRSAKVTVDPKAVAIYQTGHSDKATFKVLAFNATPEWQADGVFLRLLEVTAPAGTNFDAGSNLKLTWNGDETKDLWRSPADGKSRSIPPNRQAEIGGELVGVAPGEYTVKVGLGAANATVEGEGSVTMKLYVKHGIVWPIVVLLFAIGVSWFATKGLEALRRRVSQLKKIGEIQPDWLREEPAPLPAVAARALLKQAQDRNRSWFAALFGQDTTGARLDRAELLLKILARVRNIQSRIKSAAWTTLVRNRANKVLGGIIGSLDPGTVDGDTVKKLEAGLDGLEKWFDSKQFDDEYWRALRNDMDGLAKQVNPDAFTQHAALVKDLREKIKSAIESKDPPRDEALSRVEESYAELKVLWEREQEGDADGLKTLGDKLKDRPQMSIEEFFRESDGAAWSKLKDAEFEFIAPVVNEVDPPRGYQLIRFEIAPKQRTLGRNYLFKHRLEYAWTLEFHKKSTWFGAFLNWFQGEKDEKKPLTKARTNEPCVVQYVPDQGTLHLSVTLHYNDETSQKRIAMEPLRIQRSSEYGWLSAFQMNEVIAVGIAAAAALLSGLMTYYLNKPGFGSLSDYITLFIWGAGTDQTKNFIQNLERVSGKT